MSHRSHPETYAPYDELGAKPAVEPEEAFVPENLADAVERVFVQELPDDGRPLVLHSAGTTALRRESADVDQRLITYLVCGAHNQARQYRRCSVDTLEPYLD